MATAGSPWDDMGVAGEPSRWEAALLRRWAAAETLLDSWVEGRESVSSRATLQWEFKGHK